ncbi:MAG: flagellar basal-body MS-ring/collar protein FliF [Candidatus Manganitrophaceae bacterium]
MADLLEQMNRQITTLPIGRKIALLLLLAGTVAGGMVLWLWIQKPDLQVLYSNLSSDDAASVVAKLKEGHVPYTLSADGSAILIPAEQVHEWRLQLAGQGLPQGGGVGFEIFDRNSFGTTEFVQKLNYRRAIQGELGRTIGQLAEVHKARVHLAIPERSLFSERQEPARASVALTLKSGKRLSEGQIQGIVHLVSSSVEGLSPQAITVIDQHGQILSKTTDGPSATGLTSTQLDYQKNLEKETEGKIQSMLERVVGSEKAVVRVTSLLDFRRVELTEEKFDPDTQVVRSEQRAQEQANGTSANSGPSGIPGVRSNTPPGNQAASPTGTTASNNSQKKNEVINYEISKTVSRIVEPVGAIKKLSVAVLVDGTYEPAQGETGRKYLPRSEEEMKKLEELVKKAMGYSAERQDQVEVVNIPFETGPVSEGETPENPSLVQTWTQWLPLARLAAGPLLAVIIFFLVVRPILKALLAPTAPPVLASSSTSNMAFPENAEPRRIETSKDDQTLKLAKENPQVATQVIKKWIKEG